MKNFVLLLATAGGIGYFPFASGTLASALAIFPAWLLHTHVGGYVSVCLGLLLLGVWSAGRAEIYLQQKDPHPVVIDEIAGYFIAAAFLPSQWFYWGAAFLLFRLFDIWKPIPIHHLQRLPGGWGIMLDDILAGIYTNLILQVVHRILAF